MDFISAKTDFGFKKIFASPQSKEVLISFLNGMIYDGNPTIEDLEILDPYLAPSITGLKDSYLDVKAKINGNKIVIIEMQVLNVAAFAKRVIYNAAKTYVTQLKRGEGYSKLNPLIALTITDFVLFDNTDKFISRFVFQEKEEKFEYLDGEIELVFVELPKFTKELGQIENLSQSWVYFIKNAPLLDQVPDILAVVPEIQTAFAIADRANLTLKELEELEKREMFFEDQRGAIIKGIEKATKEALEKGREEGLIQGQIALIMRQITRRFGEISPETETRICQLSVEKLESLAEVILDFQNIEALLSWLENEAT